MEVLVRVKLGVTELIRPFSIEVLQYCQYYLQATFLVIIVLVLASYVIVLKVSQSHIPSTIFIVISFHCVLSKDGLACLGNELLYKRGLTAVTISWNV